MKKVFVALDVNTREKSIELAWHKLDPSLCGVKVGMELFTTAGIQIIHDLKKLKYDIFLDLKYHDIPNTVAGAVSAACDLGVSIVNVHTLGGKKMMEAAANAVSKATHKPILLGVTVLTSMDMGDLEDIGIIDIPSTASQVLKLASLAKISGLDGVVCSGKEISLLREYLPKDFKLIVPGIRLPDGDVGDQKRIVTPEKAFMDGADWIVVGRPITEAKDPLEALFHFNSRIAAVTIGNKM